MMAAKHHKQRNMKGSSCDWQASRQHEKKYYQE